jgi:peroxiredoxin
MIKEAIMKILIKSRTLLIALFSLILFAGFIFSQENRIRPVTVGQPMPDFSLPSYQGGEVTLSNLKSKNVLLIFPRGLAGEAHWCHIDNYRYAELMDLEKKENLRKKYNLEILYVLPYSQDVVDEWVTSNPEQLEQIEEWKNPSDPEKLDERGKRRMSFAKRAFPKSFSFKKGEVPTPFPILIDGDRKVSKGLGIFATEWGGSKVDQCMSSVFIVDKEGILQFKYIGQNTSDRPSFDYLIEMLEKINK